VKQKIFKVIKFYPLFISGGFWYLTMFPGIMTPDSYYTILYAKGESPLTSLHTVVFSLYVKFFSLNGSAIYIVSLLNLLLNITALYMVIFLIFEKYKQKTIILVTSLIFFTPFFGPISVSIWKDSVYNSLTILGIVNIIIYFKKPQINRKLGRLLLSFFVLILGSAFRTEGFYLIIVAGLFLYLIMLINKFSRKSAKINKMLPLILIISGLFSFLFQSFLIQITNAPDAPNYQKSLSFLLDLEYVNSINPNLLQPDTKQVLNEISTGGSLLSAKNCSGVWDFFGEGFNEAAASKYYVETIKLWLKEIKLDPRETILEARFCRGKSVIPVLFSNPPIQGWWPTIGISPNDLGYSHPSFTSLVYPIGYAWNYLWKYNGSLVGWPGMHLSFLLLVVFFTSIGKSIRKLEIFRLLMIIVCLRFIIFLVIAPSQEFRYYYLVYFLSIPILVLFVMEYLRKLAHNT